MFKRKMFLLGIGLFLLAGLLGTVVVGAQGGGESGDAEIVAAYFTDEEGNTITLLATDPRVTDGRGIRTPSDLEALYPKSDEASIVHQVPEYPVVVDGVRYEPEEITRFNGQVLRFVWDDRTAQEGVLYAFTTVEGLERYLKEQWDWPPSQESQVLGEEDWSHFYAHWWYGIPVLKVNPGNGMEDLRLIGFDNEISSMKVGPLASWATLYDLPNYQGAEFWRQRNSNVPVLWLYEWNDRADSVFSWQ